MVVGGEKENIGAGEESNYTLTFLGIIWVIKKLLLLLLFVWSFLKKFSCLVILF